jgi:glutamate racemase
MDNRPIGVFDSGIGGLTVASALHRAMPKETLIYFGDTAHMPYGEKSAELIRAYATRITDHLLHEFGCKTIVIACNSASAAAYEVLRDHHKGVVPVINVIDPMIEAVIADDTVHHVGIIGTNATIQAGVYQEKLSRRKASLRFSAMATPLLAGMIEAGFHDNTVSRVVLHEYLSDPQLQSIDSLILACTHYPLIKAEINDFFEGRVKLFDSAEVVTSKLKAILAKEGLLTDASHAQNRFLVSDLTESFEKTTRLFYGELITLEYAPIWLEREG